MKLNKELALEAKKHNICEDWFNDLLHTEGKERLIEMYLDGIDFCLSNEYPSLSFIKQNFVGVMEKYGIFLDGKFNTTNSRHVVALGSCTGSSEYIGFGVGQVFVKHTSKLTVRASGNAFVMVDMFDESEVEVIATDNAKICVNHYGGNLTTTTEDETSSGNSIIKVIRKQSKTY
jgi:hypothetical protein